MNDKKKKVAVLLSGGVDSAVAAHIVKETGAQVTGVFIRGWEPDFLPCTGAEDRISAMQVAAHLEIPFITLDLGSEYLRDVVKPFIASYASGETPNPDVLCNRSIKFGAAWNKLKSLGFTAIATGHYARTDGSRLMAAKDPTKDQVYFLWTLTKDDLSHTLFPLGSMLKSEVRAHAKRLKLPNAERPDSQGLCFLGHVDMYTFLHRYIDEAPGDIVDESNRKVGKHRGVHYYTIGQGIVGDHSERYYIASKDSKSRKLTVSSSPKVDDSCMTYAIRDANILGDITQDLHVQTRYHGPLLSARIRDNEILFDEPVAVAEGQSVVWFSSSGECVGGATIGTCLK